MFGILSSYSLPDDESSTSLSSEGSSSVLLELRWCCCSSWAYVGALAASEACCII